MVGADGGGVALLVGTALNSRTAMGSGTGSETDGGMGMDMGMMQPGALLPEILLLGGAVVCLLGGSFLPRQRQWIARIVALTALVAAAVGMHRLGQFAVSGKDVFFGARKFQIECLQTRRSLSHCPIRCLPHILLNYDKRPPQRSQPPAKVDDHQHVTQKRHAEHHHQTNNGDRHVDAVRPRGWYLSG